VTGRGLAWCAALVALAASGAGAQAVRAPDAHARDARAQAVGAREPLAPAAAGAERAFLPDSAVLLRVGGRVIRVRDFVERYFASYAEFRPPPDSLGRVAFLRGMMHKEVLALTARSIDRRWSAADSAALLAHTDRVLGNVLFQRAVRDSVRVTEADVRREYASYGRERRFARIRLADPREAAALRQALSAGRLAWNQAARRHAPPGTGPGGDAGWIGPAALGPRLAEAVRDLRPGGLSPVTCDAEGCHLLRCLGERPVTPPDFESVRDRLREEIRRRREGSLADRLQARVAWRIGLAHDTTSITRAAARFREAERSPERSEIPVIDLSASLPRFAPEDTARVLARHHGGQVTLGDFLRARQGIPVALQGSVGAFAGLRAQLDAMVLAPHMAELARERGLERDPMAVREIENKREEIQVQHLYDDSVGARVTISPADRQRYYEERVAQFVTHPRARFAAIVRPTRAGADSLLARLGAGASAAEILRADSLAGTLTGGIREVRQDQRGPYHAILFGELRPGQATVVGPDREGTFMVLQLLELDTGRQLGPEEAAPIVEESLRNLGAEAALQALIARLARRYEIEIHPERVMRIRLRERGSE
jgi:hypothetical protein